MVCVQVFANDTAVTSAARRNFELVFSPVMILFLPRSVAARCGMVCRILHQESN